MLPLLERKLGPRFIQLKKSEQKLSKRKQHFYKKYGIPGVIGCIDGTNIKIMRPGNAEQVYFNRLLRLGSEEARAFLQEEYDSGSRANWLRGDSGYPLEPFLLTPYRNATAMSNQNTFNLRHASARNVIERTFGVFKSRFRLLQEILLYNPLKVTCIINVCCVLHNLCREQNDQEFRVVGVNERREKLALYQILISLNQLHEFGIA
ncbi:LOW QUALITY PROTEIN: putative nuclease HARBI1 [Drosophila obscura]|uniref:LOW QUALITY PROTEIN: putative nuclease HARBI1 n=1 Tax=Drosophila obscura TaxID=7282 RepID=UPI001BB0DFE0|nr:LOW QUALITY PROTEIN: putative nuclease HARBI1 [Drosophila obscura]